MPVRFQSRFLTRVFRGLASRNYRLFFLGHSLSLVGGWVQRTALVWLVYRLTGSAQMLGLVVFLGLFPSVLIAPFAGVLSDRFDRRTILVRVQIILAVHAGLLFWLSITDRIAMWNILPLALFFGIAIAFEMPTRQAFVRDLADKSEDMGNLIALNSTIFNLSRLVGPPIAGFLITLAGEWLCFLLNMVTFVVVIAALLAMRLTPKPVALVGETLLTGVSKGLRYAWTHPTIRTSLLLLTSYSLLGMVYFVLLPIIAVEVLGGGAATLGWLTGAPAIGALLGGFFLASRTSTKDLTTIIPRATLVFGCAILGLAFARSLPFALIALSVAGFGMIIQNTGTNTLIQHHVDDRMRGRVMSLFTASLLGTSPIGSLLGGFASDRVGVTATLATSGFACMALGLAYRFQIARMDGVLSDDEPNKDPDR
ncbi:MAG: MFS transporter [Verrucomicrobia bacterium]|nr:MAG: MFS transporter [Verrucomicrobiota bacterium]